MLLHHAYWKHDLRPTNETIKNVIRNGELLEYHDEANTDRLLFSYEDYHYVLDLDDEKVVTVYKPLIRKRLSDRDNIRGIYSNGNLHNIKTDGIQEVADEMALTEQSLIKTVDRLWLKLSITTRQQFIRFWKSVN